MKEIGKRSKKFVWVKALGPLTVLVFSTSLVVGARLGCDPAKRNPNPLCVRIVGPIPKGLPRETVSWWVPMSHFREKLGVAALVCAIDLMESVSIAVREMRERETKKSGERKNSDKKKNSHKMK